MTKTLNDKLIYYALIRDFIYSIKFLLWVVLIISILFLMIYIVAPYDIFLKIVYYYLPIVLRLIGIPYFLGLSTWKVLIRWIAPYYELTPSELKLYPRTLRFIVDPPCTIIMTSNIKQVITVDTNTKVATYLLGIELGKNQIHKSKKDSFVRKLAKTIFYETLSYRVIWCIPKNSNLSKYLSKFELQTFEGNLFQRLVFYLLFL